MGLRAGIAECEAEGDRIVHDAVHQLARARSLGPERARLHNLVEAVDDVVDAIDDAAHDIAAAASLVAPARSTAVASLVDVVDRAADPLDAIRGQAVLERLRSVEDACARVLSVVLPVSAEHR